MSATLRGNISLAKDSTASSDIWISDEACRIVQYVFYVYACQSISVFGTWANIVNTICFIKQGFQDSVNVNFVALALSDMGCLITLLFIGIGYSRDFQAMDKPFDSIEMMYLTVGWPHLAFTRVTSYITALITLERCLCISMPMKVKSTFTPRRASVIILSIYGFVFCSVVPVYCVNWYTWKFSPENNRTFLALDFIPLKDEVEFMVFAFNTVGPFIAFLIIITCTSTLAIKLKKKSKWRMKSVVSSQAQEIGSREKKVTKMVVVLSLIFIVCYFPICLMFMVLMVIPGATLGGKNVNISIVIGGIGSFLEAVNSSMNLIVYYSMSSKYRALFLKLFKLRRLCEIS